ncbi:MAG: serine hydrolase [bacterium]|nr:serine hydrolase [bacterium]
MPADPERSLFRIASVSKTFVWTALMQLNEQGVLNLEADVGRYIDFDIPQTYEEPIRIWHLMTHTPGFEDKGLGMAVRNPSDMPPLRQYLIEEMPTRVRPPGEHAAYSNYATALAGFIIEQVSGQSWSDYVDEQILLPLGMTSTNTHTEMSAELLERHAIGYRYRSGRFVRNDPEYMKDAPAGIMSTTADDMTRFMLAHLNGGEYDGITLLTEISAQEMQTPLFDPHESLSPLLHGFYRSDRNGQIVFGHGGDISQFHSNLSLLPECGLGIFVSFNSDPAGAARSKLIAAFIDHFFPSDFLRAAPEAVSVDLADYQGEYIPLRSNWSSIERLGILINNLSVSSQEDELLLKTSRGTSRWTATSADHFVDRYRDRYLVFERDASGAVTHLVIGSPLGSSKRVHGLDAPGNIKNLLVVMTGIAAFGIFGYAYRAIARAPKAGRLPLADVIVGWLFAILLVGLYFHLGKMMTGDMDVFVLGMPKAAHINLILMNVNVLVGIAVIGLSVRQWVNGSGGIAARSRYSILAFAALISIWMAWYFNMMGYLLS